MVRAQYTTQICDIVKVYDIGSHPSRIDNSKTDSFLSEVDCDGNEVRLTDCSNSADGHCGRDEVAGVRCEGT